MPFKSKAQMSKFYADPELRPYADEWAAETPDIKSLPKRKKKRKARKLAANPPEQVGGDRQRLAVIMAMAHPMNKTKQDAKAMYRQRNAK